MHWVQFSFRIIKGFVSKLSSVHLSLGSYCCLALHSAPWQTLFRKVVDKYSVVKTMYICMKSSLSPAVDHDRHLLNRAFNQNCIKSFIKPNFPRLTCQQRKRLRLDSMAKRNSRSTEYPYGPGLYNTLFLLTELEVRIVNYGPPTIYCLCAKRAHRKSRWGWGGRRICNLQYRPGRRS